MVDGCVQGIPQRSDVPGYLSEEHAALEGGQEQVRQLGRVSVGADAAPLSHLLEPFAEDVPPLVEGAGELVMDIEIGLDDLARERTQRAALLVGALVSDVEVGPLPKGAEVVELAEPIAAEEVEDTLGLPCDDRQDETLLGRELVIEL